MFEFIYIEGVRFNLMAIAISVLGDAPAAAALYVDGEISVDSPAIVVAGNSLATADRAHLGGSKIWADPGAKWEGPHRTRATEPPVSMVASLGSPCTCKSFPCQEIPARIPG